MKKKTKCFLREFVIFIILILLFCFVGIMGSYASGIPSTKIYHSNFSDNETYIESTSISWAFRDNVDEFSANGSQYKSPTGEKWKASLNADWSYQELESFFMFASYDHNSKIDKDYSRLGFGLSVVPYDLDNMYKFPFRHKFSVAVISQSGRDNLIDSFRYKFEGHHNRVGVKCTVFFLGYSETIDSVITLKIGDNASLKYKYNYLRLEDYKESSASTGIEVKF